MSAAVPAALPDLGLDLGLSLGAIELGVLFSTLFYGMALVQTYTYFMRCSQDALWLKAFVGVVGVLETLHTGLIWTYLYHLTVGSFGNPFALLELPWYFDLSIGTQGCISTTVQMFYTWRIYNVSKKVWLVGPVFVVELFRLGMCATITALSWQDGSLLVFRERYDYVVYTTLVTSVVIDLWNTSVLCFYLRSKKTSISRTMNIINDIMLWAIETGLITTTTAALVLAFWSAMPDNGLWACFLIIYAKMFSNSLLVSLNSRSSVREGTRSTAHVAQSGGVSVSRSYNVEISGVDGTISTADVPLDDLKTDRQYAI